MNSPDRSPRFPVECPGCHKVYKLPGSADGRTASCKNCGVRFRVEISDGDHFSTNTEPSTVLEPITPATDDKPVQVKRPVPQRAHFYIGSVGILIILIGVWWQLRIRDQRAA